MLEAETMQSAGFHCGKAWETEEWVLPSSTDLRQNQARGDRGYQTHQQSSSDQGLSQTGELANPNAPITAGTQQNKL